jgi:hypothetical protein
VTCHRAIARDVTSQHAAFSSWSELVIDLSTVCRNAGAAGRKQQRLHKEGQTAEQRGYFENRFAEVPPAVSNHNLPVSSIEKLHISNVEADAHHSMMARCHGVLAIAGAQRRATKAERLGQPCDCVQIAWQSSAVAFGLCSQTVCACCCLCCAAHVAVCMTCFCRAAWMSAPHIRSLNKLHS